MKRVIAVLGVLAAVASHRCIDLLVGSGLARGTGDNYAHVAIAPTVVASTAMLAGLVGFAIADRGTWFTDLVREVEEMRATRIFVAIATLCAFSLFAMESLEQLLATGHLFGPLTWLGTTLPVALSVFVSIAAAMTVAIARGARSLDAVIRAVRSLACGLTIGIRARTTGTATRSTFALPFAHARTRDYARACGLRAPPQTA